MYMRPNPPHQNDNTVAVCKSRHAYAEAALPLMGTRLGAGRPVVLAAPYSVASARLPPQPLRVGDGAPPAGEPPGRRGRGRASSVTLRSMSSAGAAVATWGKRVIGARTGKKGGGK